MTISEFSDQEEGSLSLFPRLFGSGEAMIHAPSSSLEFGRQGSTTVHLLVLVLILRLIVVMVVVPILLMSVTFF